MTSAAIHVGVFEIVMVEIIRPACVGAWPCQIAKVVKDRNEGPVKTDERPSFEIISLDGSCQAGHGHLHVMLAADIENIDLTGLLGTKAGRWAAENGTKITGGRPK